MNEKTKPGTRNAIVAMVVFFTGARMVGSNGKIGLSAGSTSVKATMPSGIPARRSMNRRGKHDALGHLKRMDALVPFSEAIMTC